MRYDVEIPTCREGIFTPVDFATPAEVTGCIQLAERLGYETVWATDFIAPCPSSGVSDEQRPNWYEPMIALAHAAGVTSRIRLGTGVVMMPYRDTVMLAKQAATLDQFSGGRFVLGMGLGAYKDEFNMVRPRDKKVHRGRLLDDQLEAIIPLLGASDSPVSYAGEYVEVDGLRLNPKSVQQPLPIYVPCRNDAMIERAAKWRLGAMFSANDATAQLQKLNEALERHGGSPGDVDVIGEGELRIAPTHEEAVTAYKASHMGQYRTKVAPARSRVDLDPIIAKNWIGTVDDVVEKISRAKEAGLNHVNALHIAGDTMEERLEQMHLFAEEVMPKVG